MRVRGRWMHPVMPRLLARCSVDDQTGCWNWTGTVNERGYGKLWAYGKNWKVSILSFLLHKGESSAGKCVLHSCDNPRCFNPEHLRAGTNAENSADMVRKGRSAKGSKVASAKLTEPQIREILNSNERHRVIAQRYGVSRTSISVIKRRERWLHVH